MTTRHHDSCRLFGSLLLATLLAGTALASDRDIDQTRKVDKDARVTIENLAGSVEVTGNDSGEVHITGTLDTKAEELAIEGGGKSLHIEVKYPHKHNMNIREGSRLVITLPHGCQVAVETVSADATIDGVEGEVKLETVSGDVDVRGKPAELEVESVSGDLAIRATTKRASLTSVSGEIKADGLGEDVSVSTVSGDIEVMAASAIADLRGETVSGDIEIQARPAKSADWKVSSQSGDVDLWLPADIDADFDIETFSGDIRDGFGHEAERTSKYAPGRELKFTQGDGGADIEVSAFSGDVTIRRK